LSHLLSKVTVASRGNSSNVQMYTLAATLLCYYRSRLVFNSSV